ncbi:MAG: 3D-(3,5/4)-trihydroxycyclohexane-1,2-dione acylhydrolase (decyclizing), partial [Myxococcales bacterium]|nr:3D-(3,5/4)-trihydroxycyclohexane-1,2-dione acylhydrolase (decyclizing) [Myxococcales bacterium]
MPRLTVAQATIAFLKNQYVERDGKEVAFFGGCFGIFGHGNVAGLGQALQENLDFPYFPARNEQAMVHAAAAYAKMHNRLRTMVCTTSIGPGATNMITAAAGATINRLPVLLLPGDIFARRDVDPVLQQLESPQSRDVSVNDCFRPVSRYWDRVWRPEQLATALMGAMRVLTSPADTGAVTLAMPQDVQAEAFDFPEALFKKRVWRVGRALVEPSEIARAAEWIRESKRPLIITGGGTIYGEATDALRALGDATGIPVAETQAGKGALPWDHAVCLGAIGSTGTLAANHLAKKADLILGIGTRYSDFTTQSQTLFQHPHVRFVNLNVVEMDAHKQGALPLVGDARRGLEALLGALQGYRVDDSYTSEITDAKRAWDAEVDRVETPTGGAPLAQAEVLGALNRFVDDRDVVICAAGSMPGDLHKLWRPRDPKAYHVEYGYSCMGYEVAAGLGVRMAAPDRGVYVLVGDGSYLMMAQEIVTAVQEGIPFTVVVVDNHGYGSIGALSESLGSGGFGTRYRKRSPNVPTPALEGDVLPIDFAANAESLGAKAFRAKTLAEFEGALGEAKGAKGPVVIVVETDPQ